MDRCAGRGGVAWLVDLVRSATRRRALVDVRLMPTRRAWHRLVAGVAGIFAVLLARKVFRGAGIVRTAIGALRPWLAPACVALAVWLRWRFADTYAKRGPRHQLALALTFVTFSLAAGAFLLDACSPGGYLYLHVLLIAAGTALANGAVDRKLFLDTAKQAAFALSLATLPSLLMFPSSAQARTLLIQRNQWNDLDAGGLPPVGDFARGILGKPGQEASHPRQHEPRRAPRSWQS